MYLSSEKGRRTLTFCYSWGAAIVILGAMFKIVHMPYANAVLCFALVVEALVFLLSAFEPPAHDYTWEDVFPVLKSKNPLDRPKFAEGTVSGSGGGVIGGTVVAGGGSGGFAGGTGIAGGGGSGGFAGGAGIAGGGGSGVSVGGVIVVGNFEGSPLGSGVAGGVEGGQGGQGVAGGFGGGPIVIGGGGSYVPPTPQESVNIGLTAMGLNVSEEDAENLANSIRKLGEAAEQISKMADLTTATQAYIDQMSTVSRNLERFSAVTGSLSEVSDTIVNSCKVISGADAAESEQKITGYVQQMEQLNRNLSGLNQFYEVHLNGLRSQMETIHLINAGLNRIREMYDSSVVDSSAFRAENERMAQLLAQLNLVYSRLLQAMTVNAPSGAGMPYNPQPPYPGQAYPQSPYMR